MKYPVGQRYARGKLPYKCVIGTDDLVLPRDTAAIVGDELIYPITDIITTEPAAPAAPQGLANIGNTCWLNAAIQAIKSSRFINESLVVASRQSTNQHLRRVIAAAICAAPSAANWEYYSFGGRFALGATNSSHEYLVSLFGAVLDAGMHVAATLQYYTIMRIRIADGNNRGVDFTPFVHINNLADIELAGRVIIVHYADVPRAQFPAMTITVNGAKYSLVSAVVYRPGHYVAYVRRADVWFLANDSQISTAASVSGEIPVLAIYEN